MLLGTSDWLRAQPEGAQTGDSARDERLGVIVVLAASLEQEVELTTPPRWLTDRLHGEIVALPPQFGCLDATDPVGGWLLVAAVAEDLGAAGLAVVIINRLVELLTSPAGAAARFTKAEKRERLGMCWARRGRLSRIAGHLDDAEECYREAARLASRKPWCDAYPLALVGLSLLALNRGNMPEGERHARAILRHRPRVHAMYGLQAHQMLAYTNRRRGSLLDALLHAWEAFDLLDRDDFRRDELVLVMAEIAAEFGDLDAAANGFASVRLSHARARIRIPALSGALNVAIRRFSENRTQESRTALADHLQALDVQRNEMLAPNDRMIALLAVVEGALTLGELILATSRLAEAEEVARVYGYFEKQFRVEALQRLLRELKTAAAVPTQSDPDGTRNATEQQRESTTFRHPALLRLRRLALARASSSD